MPISDLRAATILVSAASLVLLSDVSLAQSTPKLHPVKAACVDYESSGQMMNGTSTRCHRNYAHEAYEIQDMKVGFAGMSQTQKQHSITIGDTIYSIDLNTNTGTKTTNPMYAGLVSSMENADPEEMSAQFMATMGFTPNGQSKEIANTDCDVFSSAQLGTVCLTDDGLMLEQDFMGNKTVAVRVSRGDSGDDANYTLYENVPISDGPDLSQGLQGIEGLEGIEGMEGLGELMKQLGQQQ